MKTNVNQLSIFGTIIKEDVWELKLKDTKGNRDRYVENFDADINEWLKNLPDRKKVDRFKQCFYSSLFDTYVSKGIYDDMTSREIYQYEYSEAGMDLKGIYIFDKWFYKGSYIHLHNYDGIFELIINDISTDSIEVTHRFGKDKFFKKFNSVDELIAEMWSLDDIKSLDTDLSAKSDKETWFIYSLTSKAINNFDRDNEYIKTYLEDLFKRSSKEIRNREYTKASKFSEENILNLIASNVYNYSWDTVKESIDNDSKQKAISMIIRNRINSGGPLTHERFTLAGLHFDTKGVIVKTRDNRIFKFSWSKIYDAIQARKSPKQIDIFSMINQSACL